MGLWLLVVGVLVVGVLTTSLMLYTPFFQAPKLVTKNHNTNDPI